MQRPIKTRTTIGKSILKQRDRLARRSADPAPDRLNYVFMHLGLFPFIFLLMRSMREKQTAIFSDGFSFFHGNDWNGCPEKRDVDCRSHCPLSLAIFW